MSPLLQDCILCFIPYTFYKEYILRQSERMAELDESCLAAGAKASSRLGRLSIKTGNG